MKEIKKVFDFYDKTYLKSYNLDDAIQYQLNLLDSLDVYTRKHVTCVKNYIYQMDLQNIVQYVHIYMI